MNKHGYTDFYYHLNISCSNAPSCSLLTYRDDLVFMVEYNQISYVDVGKLVFYPSKTGNGVSKLEKNKLFTTLPNGRPAKGLLAISRT